MNHNLLSSQASLAHCYFSSTQILSSSSVEFLIVANRQCVLPLPLELCACCAMTSTALPSFLMLPLLTLTLPGAPGFLFCHCLSLFCFSHKARTAHHQGCIFVTLGSLHGLDKEQRNECVSSFLTLTVEETSSQLPTQWWHRVLLPSGRHFPYLSTASPFLPQDLSCPNPGFLFS